MIPEPVYIPLPEAEQVYISDDSHGNLIVRGIIPEKFIRPGQIWLGSSGHSVEVVAVKDGWVDYKWIERGVEILHDKNSFAFQCRYSLKIG